MYVNSLSTITHAGHAIPRDQKLTGRDRSMIQGLTAIGFTRREVARMYQVDPSAVRQIELGVWTSGYSVRCV